MVLRLGIGAAFIAACAGIVWTMHTGSAAAQPGGVKLKLAGGALSVSAPDASAVVGASVNVRFTVTDARGTGDGWSLQLSSERPVTVSKLVVRCAPDSTCTLPSAAGLAKLPTILRANQASGMGVFTVVATLAPLKAGPAVPVRFAVSP